jgi:hypothetical protein
MFPYYLWFAVLLLAAAVPQFLLAWRHRKWLFPELVLGTAAVLCLCEALAWVDFDAYLWSFREKSLPPNKWASELYDYVWREHGWWFVASSGVAFVCSLWVAILAPPGDRRPALDGPIRWRASACVIITALAIVLGHRAGFIGPPRPPWTAMESQSRSGVTCGLQVAVRSLRREGDKMYLGYTFRVVGNNPNFARRNIGFMRPFRCVSISFSDAAGNKVGCDSTEIFWLTEEFLLFGKRANMVEDSAEVDIPGRAKFVSIDMGGVVTRPVAIPE